MVNASSLLLNWSSIEQLCPSKSYRLAIATTTIVYNIGTERRQMHRKMASLQQLCTNGQQVAPQHLICRVPPVGLD